VQVVIVLLRPNRRRSTAGAAPGVPVWVKVLTTATVSTRSFSITAPTDEVNDPTVWRWQGKSRNPAEIERWSVKRPPGNPGDRRVIEGSDELPEGDETVTRRYEFYEYPPVELDDGEAQCDNPADCEGAVGNFTAPDAGLNVEEPLA
jgi:hypothetical protein